MGSQILLVDDDAGIRDFVTFALLDEGYQVVTARNGAEALSRVADARPDLILLDMRMPVMDGWEFARVYRQTPAPRAPIIVITAARDAAEFAAQIDADGYLAKPFDLNVLLAMVGQHVSTG